MICTRYSSLVTLKFKIKIIAKQILIPLDSFFCLCKLTCRNAAWNLSTQTCRTDNQSFVIFFQFHTVGTRTHIESLGPCFRYQFDKVVITLQVFSKYHQVVSTLVSLSFLISQTTACDIHFTTDNRLEELLLGSFQLFTASSKVGFRILRLSFSTFQCSYLFLQILYFTVGPAILLIYIIEEFLYTEHITMIGNSNASHAVGYGFIY